MQGRDKRATGARVTTWIIRWLADSTSDTTEDKLAALGYLLRKGLVVAVQETHLDAVTASLGPSLIPGANVAQAPARLGRREGPQGGAANLSRLDSSWSTRKSWWTAAASWP